MQYSSFIDDHIPCRYKSLIEDSALRQLMFASEDRPKIWPEFIPEFRNRSTKGKSSTSVKENARDKKKAKGEDDAQWKRLSLKDVFRLIAKLGRCTRSFRGWVICPIIHDKPVLFGLPDDPKARLRRFNSLYLNGLDDSMTKRATLSYGSVLSSRLTQKPSNIHLDQLGQKSATKVRSCHVRFLENNSPALRTRYADEQIFVRPASSAPLRDQRNIEYSASAIVDQNSSNREIAVIDFQHDEGEVKYVASYRDGYTYRKIRAQRPCSSSTSSQTQSPSGHSSSRQTPARPPPVLHINGSLSSTKSAPNATQGTIDAKDNTKHARTNKKTDNVCHKQVKVEVEPKCEPVRWQANQRFRDICDPQLTVNNPPPTEVAVLCQIPHCQMFHTSSPSIPSNTNGKFGGKAKDKPYPFELHISAASCQVKNTAKKTTKSLLNFT